MVKKRNILLSILAVILVSVSFVLFACGDLGNAKDTFQAYKTTIETYKANDTLFSTNTIENINTDFYLNNFYSKNNDGTQIQDDVNYIILNAVGLNFIDKYYTRLENLEGSFDFNPLNDNLNKMNESYNALKVENQNLANIESTAENSIYSGYFARYKSYSKYFINSVYATALTLGDFLVNKVNVGSSIGTDSQQADDFDLYADYQLLLIFEDLRLVLMQSCDGQVLQNQIYNSASNYLKNFAKNVQAKEKKSLDNEKVLEFKNILDAFNNQRASYITAVNGFSIYQYLTTYDSSLEAYVKADSNTDTYYNQLLNYYCLDNNYMTLIYNYLTTNLVN